MTTAPIRILVIDDNHDTLAALDAIVRKVLPCATLAIASTGAQAIALALAENPDVLVLGTIKDVGSFDLCRQFKANATLGDIPVLFFISPHTERASRVMALEAGADGFLATPLDEQELSAQIRAMARITSANRMQRRLQAQRAALVAERTWVEEALRKSDERLKTVERIAYIGHYEIDIATGAVFWSEATFAIFGLDANDPSPTVETYAHLIHPDDRATVYQEFEQSVSEGKPFDLEYRIVHATGEIRYVHSLAKVTQDGQGHRKMFGTFQDITEHKQAVDALRKSEGQYRRIVDTALEGIWAMDGQRLTTFVNPHLAAMLSYDSQEMIGRPVEDFMFEEDLGDHFRRMQKRYRGQDGQYECRFRSKDGREIWTMVSAAALLDSAGHFAGSIGMFTDITSRKRAEAALQESEARYRSLLELAPIGIAVHSEGKIVFANPAAARLLGADSPAQLAGKLVSEIVHPDYWPATLSRIPRMLAGEQGIYPVEDVYVRMDGTPIDVEVIVMPLTFQGKPAVQAIVLDITERKRAEAERARLLTQVQAQAQQITQILDTVPQGVLLLDESGQVLLANPTGVRDLAALANASVGERLTGLGNLPLTKLLASAPTGPWHEIRTGQRIFEAIARPIVATQPGPAAGHWVVVIDNVTYQRTVSEQLQQQERLAAIGQLAAGIAHDFNNILAIIALQATMAARTPDLAARDRDRMTIISEQTANAAALIQQILDFSRRAVLERQPLDLGPLLREQVKLLARTLPENIQVTLECESGEYVVLADPTRIQQMVMNLAVNARDAMAHGGSLRMVLARQSSPPRPNLLAGPWIRLTVTDSGTGIASEALAHLFEPFFTTKPHGQGTGLGLAQVYGIVKQHAGEIDVHSVAGQGAIFTIYLPALAAEAPPAAAAAVELTKGNGATILLVEDNVKLLEVMSDVVEMLGYTVVGAANGKEALDVLEKRASTIDLVLTDLIMPKMGGDALLAAMRARGLTIPVVILSGHPLDNELAGLRERGLSGWLLKPPKMQDLAQILAQALAA